MGNIQKGQALNLFVEVFEEEAKEKAREIDQKIQAGTAGRLAGLVIGIKDVICYKDHGLTAGSKMLSGFTSLFTATALERLLAEDAIVIGRQNCDEFAMGSSNETSFYGPSSHPIQPTHVPGGSSGASAAAVAAQMCHASLGSDTGGSVRQPASFCGVVGMKPTYGRISRWGLIAYASSFDQIGPLTQSVEDAALLLEIMAGQDGKDQTAAQKEVPAFHQTLKQEGPLRFLYLKEALTSPGLDQEIKERCEHVLHLLKQEGHQVEEVSFPLLDYMVPCYYILTTAEASSNLSRYDGAHYGYRSPQAKTLEDMYTLSRSEGFGAEVQKRIMLGTFVLSTGYFDAYYAKAQKVRKMVQEETKALFGQGDILLTPTAPTPAFPQGAKTEDPIEMYLSDIFTVHANLAGMPAISLPLGQHSSGLPFGLQLMGDLFQEKQLLQAASLMMNLR